MLFDDFFGSVLNELFCIFTLKKDDTLSRNRMSQCNCNQLRKNGKSKNGTQRWLCLNRDCSTVTFQLTYNYTAYEPGIKDKIDTLTLNSSGVRDIARTLSINKNTVCAHLKKKVPKVNPFVIDIMEREQLTKLDVELHYYDTEWDEFWSFVGSKSNQRWTWYLIERQTDFIIAWHNGRRKDKVHQRLLDSVAHIPIRACHTDD